MSKNETRRKSSSDARRKSSSDARRKSSSGTRRKAPTGTLKQRLAAAKKRCFPGYDVYDYRVNRKGEFYNCAPAGMNRAKVRKTQRKKTA
jgi:hypothetical protein